jgi:two-component system chemotaxis response regulator CheY
MPKVLVVDDSPSVRQQVAMALKASGHEVVEAVDGQDGLERVRKEMFAAVISDINMPRMNGLDMLEAIKRDPKFTSLPVLMLTSEGQASMIERAKAAGARAWIVKPFKAELLVATINKLTLVT